MKLPQVEARRAGLCFHTRRAVAEHGTGRCQLLPLPTRVFPLTIMHSTPLQENIFTFFYQSGNPRAFCEVRGEASHLVLEGCKPRVTSAALPQPPIKQTSRLRTWHRKAQKKSIGGVGKASEGETGTTGQTCERVQSSLSPPAEKLSSKGENRASVFHSFAERRTCP